MPIQWPSCAGRRPKTLPRPTKFPPRTASIVWDLDYNWGDDEWKQLFRFTRTRKVSAGEALIRRGEPDRTLYFVLHGELEVIAHSGDGLSLGHVAMVSAGSVLGEQAFFDAKPRSAGAWAVDDCEVAAMSPDQYAAFEASSPTHARDLLFALGRILAMRLRRTTAKVIG